MSVSKVSSLEGNGSSDTHSSNNCIICDTLEEVLEVLQRRISRESSTTVHTPNGVELVASVFHTMLSFWGSFFIVRAQQNLGCGSGPYEVRFHDLKAISHEPANESLLKAGNLNIDSTFSLDRSEDQSSKDSNESDQDDSSDAMVSVLSLSDVSTLSLQIRLQPTETAKKMAFCLS